MKKKLHPDNRTNGGKELRKAIINFLAERKRMLDSGFPYCYTENFVPLHCDTCIRFYKERLKSHNPDLLDEVTN